MSDPVLAVANLTVVHRVRGARTADSLTAVDGVSLAVRSGEIVGIVGESGSGKTTLALAVSRLGPLSSGTVQLAGTDLGKLRGSALRSVRSQIQVIFQDPQGSLDPRQSVKSGLAELRRLHPQRTSWIGDEELLHRVRLSGEHLTRFAHQLSGGQAQRVCIARALLIRPQLLIADEPTSGLDVLVQADILQLLLQLRAEFKLSILLITHDLGVVRRICDRVYVMRRGSVVEEGEAETLMSNPSHEYTRTLLAAIPGREDVGLGEERVNLAATSDRE